MTQHQYNGSIIIVFWNAKDATQYSWDQPEYPWIYVYGKPDVKYKILVNKLEDYTEYLKNRIYLKKPDGKIIPFNQFIADAMDVPIERLFEDNTSEVVLAISKEIRNRSIKGRNVIYEFSAQPNTYSITRRDDLLK